MQKSLELSEKESSIELENCWNYFQVPTKKSNEKSLIFKIKLTIPEKFSLTKVLNLSQKIVEVLTGRDEATISLYTGGSESRVAVLCFNNSSEVQIQPIKKDVNFKELTNDIAIYDEEKYFVSSNNTASFLFSGNQLIFSLKSPRISKTSVKVVGDIIQNIIDNNMELNERWPKDLCPKHSDFSSKLNINSFVENIYDYYCNEPDSIAIVDNSMDEKINYKEFWEMSTKILSVLPKHIHHRKVRVAIFLKKEWRYLVTVLGIQRVVGEAVLMDISLPDSKLIDQINTVKPDVIITSNETVSRASEIFDHNIIKNFDMLHINKDDIPIKDLEIIASDISLMANTSGTTGKPKTVCLSYLGTCYTIQAISEKFNINKAIKGTWLSSPGYGMIEVDPLPVLNVGGTVFIPDTVTSKSISDLLQWINKNQITTTLLMTSVAEAMWLAGPLKSLSSMFIAGERCNQWPPSNVDYQIYNVYGSAEAAVTSIANLSSKRRGIVPSIGTSIDGTNMYVTNKVGVELPFGCIGELTVTGKALSLGYLDSEQTRGVFIKNSFDEISKYAYKSGDQAVAALDGNVYLIGRNDTLVKVKGHRINLNDIEIISKEIVGVKKSVATISNGMRTLPVLTLFVDSTPELERNKNKIIQHLKKNLPSYEIPNKIIFNSIKLNQNGKIDYNYLKKIELLEQKKEINSNTFVPKNDVQKLVLKYWMRWTSSSVTSEEINFFEAGGDSLRCMRMLGELKLKEHIDIKMTSFIQNPTLINLFDIAEAKGQKKMEGNTILIHDSNKQNQPFDLNESQQSLWIGRGNNFKYGNVGCQGYFEWEKDNLNISQFTSAVEKLVNRHPMLRMTINKQGKQVIGTYDGKQAVIFSDLTGHKDDKISEYILHMRDELANSEIGYDKWPLFKFVVLKKTSKLYSISLVIDMLIADAWSIFQVIMPDLIDLYNGKEEDLPKIETTFREYVQYRNDLKTSKEYKDDRKYWMEKLRELPASPKLPMIQEKNKPRKSYFKRYQGSLSKELWDKLKLQGQKYNISPSGVIAIILCVVLEYWNENDTFTLNFPVSDRLAISPDIDSIVGDFTNTLLVPYTPIPHTSFREKGQMLQKNIWEALDHRMFSGVEVLRALSKLKRNGNSPLMPVVLTSLLGHPQRHEISDFGEEVYGVSQTPQVTLDVQIRESDGCLVYKWDYLNSAIRQDVVKDMFGTFEKLLHQLVENSETWNKTELDLKPDMQKAIWEKINSTEKEIPKVHLKDLLVKRLQESPKSIAVIDSGGEYNWKQVINTAYNISCEISNMKMTNDKFIGILLPKSVLQYISVYASVLSGLGYVPMDISWPVERIQSIIQDANIHTVIISEKFNQNSLKNVEYITVFRDLISEKRIGSGHILEQNNENYSPYVIFTSGSTGKPKGVEIPEIALLNHIFDVSERFNLNSETRHLATAALHFDMSVFDVFGPLVYGGSVVLPRVTAGPSPEDWLELLHNYSINFWACVPTMMEMLCYIVQSLPVKDYSLPNCQTIVMAGDWIALKMLPKVKKLFPNANLYSAGGPTETTNWSIIHEIQDDEGKLCDSVIYGKPMNNSKYHVQSNLGIERPMWVVGEMIVESNISLSKGYLGKPDVTKKAFISGRKNQERLYKTGDLGRYLPNGDIEFVGRIDNQVKINGFRIELGEIESIMKAVDGIDKVIAFSLPDNEGNPKEVAVAYTESKNISKDILLNLLVNKLPKYMVPKKIQLFKSIPLSDNGKVDVKQMRQILNESNQGESKLNNDDMLRSVLKIICEQLDKDMVLPTDNFFNLGGDSLDAAKLKLAFSESLKVDTSLEVIMLSENITEMCDQMQKEAKPIEK